MMHLHSHLSFGKDSRKFVLIELQADHPEPPSFFLHMLLVRSHLQVDFPICKVKYHNFEPR